MVVSYHFLVTMGYSYKSFLILSKLLDPKITPKLPKLLELETTSKPCL